MGMALGSSGSNASEFEGMSMVLGLRCRLWRLVVRLGESPFLLPDSSLARLRPRREPLKREPFFGIRALN